MNIRRPTLDICWRTDGDRVRAGHVAVVVDVLRASTNIITAFSMGLRRLRATTDVEEARRLARRHKALLAGERHNRKIEGFDFGNSPLEMVPEQVKKATIVFTSTNFPHALAAAGEAGCILIGALVNVTAVCKKAVERASSMGTDVTLILAGEPVQAHALEDYSFAGKAAATMQHACTLSMAAEKAKTYVQAQSPEDLIRHSTHARELIQDGYEADVRWAFTIDRFEAVPEVQGEWIVAQRD